VERGRVMSPEVICLSEDADAANAARLILERGGQQIPVVDVEVIKGRAHSSSTRGSLDLAPRESQLLPCRTTGEKPPRSA
jgi:hypothetical protein